jgi:DNA-directed RNA polymerase subunit M/transcription elongation factor TFIIS
MTEKIFCDNCNMMLYFGEEIKRRLYMRAIPSEETVLGFYKNTCPKCGHSLSIGKVKIETKGRKTWHTTQQ